MAQNNRSASTNWRRNVAGAVAAALEDEMNEEPPAFQQPIIQPVNIQQDLIEAPLELPSEAESDEDVNSEQQNLPINPDLPINNGDINLAAIGEDAHMFEEEIGSYDYPYSNSLDDNDR